MTKPFCYFLRVRYSECDAQKVVFNSRYSDFVDLATVEFLRVLGFNEDLNNGNFEYQVVKQTVEWKAPARFDQVLELAIATKQLGTTSFTLTTEFRLAGTEQLLVTAETVYVFMEGHSMTKMPIPDNMRAILEKGAPGVVTDHAGYLNK